MTTSTSGWDVSQPNRWTSLRVLALPAVTLLVVAIVVHTSAILIGFGTALVVGATIISVLLWSLRWEDARKLAAAPAGTFFVGRGEVRLQVLRAARRFAPLAAGRRGIAVAGRVTVDETGIHFAPFRHRPQSPATAHIPWNDVLSLRAGPAPGKINVGQIDLDTRDGEHLRLQIAGYSRLVTALRRASVRQP